jgi:ABC-type antimicrobial peptide transport system ATPase subunit
LTDLFYELVHTASLIGDRNFSLEVLLIEEEEIRYNDGKGSWRRRGATIKDRRLLNVLDRVVFEDSRDFLQFLPKELDGYFTSKILASKMMISISLAQKITYCLRKMGTISIAGKKSNEFLFHVTQN